jgi:hypothetical protein
MRFLGMQHLTVQVPHFKVECARTRQRLAQNNTRHVRTYYCISRTTQYWCLGIMCMSCASHTVLRTWHLL